MEGAAPPGVLEKVTWVQCDNCEKWRRLPAELAESLADDEPWFCANNPDEAHNTCEASQELTDAEIDTLHADHEKAGAEAAAAPAGGMAAAPPGGDGGDASPDSGAPGSTPRRHKRPPVWQLITSNLYTHRERKEQDEDDIMICQCKKVWATDTTSVGCGPECLNRMLNIECAEEYCPSGHRCSNQMFTKKEYSKLEVKRAGAKGFGLFAGEDLKAGAFLIEYLGEVLEEEEYARRKEYFIETGQRHYYFMNIGNGEVIDASRRGNLGRFINHSCEPNCETQKWVVHGELAIGLFTLVDIPAGTELTFDYNFERYGDKPMKCLCRSKNCRGVIGGTQDKEGAAARAALLEAAVEMPEDELDPDFIMVMEREKDAALSAILDRVVGLGWEKGWTPKLSARLQKLATSHGVDLSALSDDDEDEPMVAAASSGMLQDEEDEDEDEPAPRAKARQPAKKGGRKPAAKKGGRKPAAPRKQAAPVDDDWRAGLSSASSGSEDESGSGDESGGEEARPGSRRSGAAAAAAKAAALAATEMPFRRRLKKFVRVAAAAEAATGSPAGSLGSRQQQAQAPRPRTTQSVASSTPASTGPLIPKRAGVAPSSSAWQPKRRSEIDRRLDELVNAAGRLRDSHPDVVIRVLRLFNLCDIGPTVSKMDSDADSGAPPGRPGSAGGPQRSDGSGPSLPQNGSASDLRALRPLSHNESGSSLHKAERGAAAGRGGGPREDGEVSPEHSAGELRSQHLNLQPPQSQGSPSKDRRAEVSSRIRAAWDEAQRSGKLSARQAARIADMSLLLDVVLKTNTLSAKKEFVKCGILRQLLGVLGGNTGKQYAVILKKMLRVVESLPLTSDDMHHTRSAHGSFADLLRDMAQSTDFEIRSKAYGLLKKFPVQACTQPLAPELLHSSAGSTRSRPPLLGTPGGGPGGLPPAGPGQPWREPGPGPGPPLAGMPGQPWREPGPGPPMGGPPPPPPGGYGGPPFRDSPMQPPRDMRPPPFASLHDGFRGREMMPPSRFGPGPPRPGMMPPGMRPGMPPMGGPPGWRPGMQPPHHMPYHGGPPPPPMLPPPPPGGMGMPGDPPGSGMPAAGPGSDTGGSRKRSRWDSDARPGEAAPPGEAAAPMPPGFGGRAGPGEPASKRAVSEGNGSYASLAAAPSWDVETQFAVGTYVSAAGGGGGNLSPDVRGTAGGAQTYSPLTGGRPMSAAYSAAGAGGAAGNGGGRGMHLSPMSDDEQPGAPPPPPADEAPAGPAGPPPLEEEAEESWDTPNEAFSRYVADMVRRRVGKYAQPEHPLCISQEDATELYSRIRREIVGKEVQAYEQRQAAGVFKPIERGKLEAKIREFVRDSIRRHHERRGGY